MDRLRYSTTNLIERDVMEQPPELLRLFHQLNNELGIILAHAELMEAKAADEPARARASLVVHSVLEAMGTAKQIRIEIGNAEPHHGTGEPFSELS